MAPAKVRGFEISISFLFEIDVANMIDMYFFFQLLLLKKREIRQMAFEYDMRGILLSFLCFHEKDFQKNGPGFFCCLLYICFCFFSIFLGKWGGMQDRVW